MAVEVTFESMGIRSKKSTALHLLLENAYDSNLLPDISNVDYLAGNLGRTNLQPLRGLPPFVDDIYVFGHLRRKQVVSKGGRIFCTEDEAKQVVARIAPAVREAFGRAADGTNRGYIETSIVHTIEARGGVEGSTIRATIAKIESDKYSKAT